MFGDAKADNFLVDKDGKLWIIDFGGSYTEAWVEEGKMETVQGDWQGVKKVAGALVGEEGADGDEGVMVERGSGSERSSKGRDEGERMRKRKKGGGDEGKGMAKKRVS